MAANKKTEDPKQSKKNKILTALILGVIALEVVLILYFMVRRSMQYSNPQNPAEAESAAENTEEAAESVEEESVKPKAIVWHGKDMQAVPNAGGKLVVDYGEDNWWEEEGFVGQYSVTEVTAGVDGVTEEFSEAMIYGNGNIVWVTDEDVFSGELFPVRYYESSAHGYAKTDSDQMPRAFNIDFVKLEDGKVSYFDEEEPFDPTYLELHAEEQSEPDPLEEIYVVLERID